MAEWRCREAELLDKHVFPDHLYAGGPEDQNTSGKDFAVRWPMCSRITCAWVRNRAMEASRQESCTMRGVTCCKEKKIIRLHSNNDRCSSGGLRFPPSHILPLVSPAELWREYTSVFLTVTPLSVRLPGKGRLKAKHFHLNRWLKADDVIRKICKDCILIFTSRQHSIAAPINHLQLPLTNRRRLTVNRGMVSSAVTVWLCPDFWTRHGTCVPFPSRLPATCFTGGGFTPTASPAYKLLLPILCANRSRWFGRSGRRHCAAGSPTADLKKLSTDALCTGPTNETYHGRGIAKLCKDRTLNWIFQQYPAGTSSVRNLSAVS